MKGPFERLKYDGRRTWECPECKHRERAECQVTSMACRCQQKKGAPVKSVCMKLVEDGLRRVL